MFLDLLPDFHSSEKGSARLVYGRGQWKRPQKTKKSIEVPNLNLSDANEQLSAPTPKSVSPTDTPSPSTQGSMTSGTLLIGYSQDSSVHQETGPTQLVCGCGLQPRPKMTDRPWTAVSHYYETDEGSRDDTLLLPTLQLFISTSDFEELELLSNLQTHKHELPSYISHSLSLSLSLHYYKQERT